MAAHTLYALAPKHRQEQNLQRDTILGTSALQFQQFCTIPVPNPQSRRLQYVYTNFLLQKLPTSRSRYLGQSLARNEIKVSNFGGPNLSLQLSPIQQVFTTCRYVLYSGVIRVFDTVVFLGNQLVSSHQTDLPSTNCTVGNEFIYGIIPLLRH